MSILANIHYMMSMLVRNDIYLYFSWCLDNLSWIINLRSVLSQLGSDKFTRLTICICIIAIIKHHLTYPWDLLYE